MRATIPTAGQVAWISIVPQLAILLLMILLWQFISPRMATLLGPITYLTLSVSLRILIPKDHRKGMNDVRMGDHLQALPYFQKSYDFFKKHNWLDHYRYITLFSSSKISYKEMALNNCAFCYTQTGEAEKAKAMYQRVLTEYPESYLASTALAFINTFTEHKHRSEHE
jgi:tetratricopeptide (TPR) repeat protein